MEPVNVVFEPSVYLVGRQQINHVELDNFLHDEGVDFWETDTDVAGQKLVETAGRICYMSFSKPRPGGNSSYIGHLIGVGHGSCLEHAVYNLILTGVSRSFTHELVRHRAGFGFSQLSQRFVDASKTEFVVPPALVDEVDAARRFMGELGVSSPTAALDVWEDDPDPPGGQMLWCGLRWLNLMESAGYVYRDISEYLEAKLAAADFHRRDRAGLIDPEKGLGPGDIDAIDPDGKTDRRKAAREAARSVLPNATETKIFVTVNGRAARHFIEMRAHPAADAEMRRVAVAVLRVLAADSPNLFGDYRVVESPRGGPAAENVHRKV